MVSGKIECIQVGFWASDLFCREAEPGCDVVASANSYAKILCKVLSDTFPGADVTVNIGHHGTGYLPRHLQTLVNGLRYHPDCDLVSTIVDEVFEGFQWPIRKEGGK